MEAGRGQTNDSGRGQTWMPHIVDSLFLLSSSFLQLAAKSLSDDDCDKMFSAC